MFLLCYCLHWKILYTNNSSDMLSIKNLQVYEACLYFSMETIRSGRDNIVLNSHTMSWTLSTLGAHVQRGLQYSVCLCVCVCVCEWVCYLANSYAVNAQIQSKIRIECKCATKGFWFVDFAKNTLFKSYGVICSLQQTLTVSTARRYIRRTTGDYW